MDHVEVVVVGSGAAGAAAAATLRRNGFSGRVVVVRREPGPPYNRTTVDKALLEGTVTVDAVTLPEARVPGIEWTGPGAAIALDPRSRVLTLDDGRSLHYDAIVIATGSAPRPFPGAVDPRARDRVLTLRTAADAERLRRWIGAGTSVTILGAGLIGAETAGLLAARAVTVNLVGRTAAPMSAHLGGIVASHLADLHRRHVTTHLGRTARDVRRNRDDRVVVTLNDGTPIESDVVLVSIGVRPETGWLAGSGLDLADGVAVDDRLRARGAENVYAAGDLARVTGGQGIGQRVEHWNHAAAQGQHAALTLLHDAGLADDPGPFGELPTYSTRLHGTRLTIIGPPGPVTGEFVIDGDPAHGRFSVALTDDDDRLVRVIGVGGAGTVNGLKDAIGTDVGRAASARG